MGCGEGCTRRSFLLGVGASALACAGGEGDWTPSPTAPPGAALGCAVDPSVGEGWVSVDLADAPQLLDVGGAAVLSAPEALLDVNVCHVEAGCYVAAWRICPHGACYLDYAPGDRRFVCPCHGSEFGEDGALLKGPATRGLRTFPAGRVGDAIWVQGQS